MLKTSPKDSSQICPLAALLQSSARRPKRANQRAGTIVVWTLPLLAVAALACYLLLAPGPRRPISAAEGMELTDVEHDLSEIPAFDAERKTATTVEQQLEGEWTGYYQGQRRLTVRADGSGTMTAEPEGIAATLLAAKLTFEIQWKINGDHMEFETTGGEPLDKVNIVLRMYGRNRSHKILKLAPDDLVLQDEDGVTEYEWHRVKSN